MCISILLSRESNKIQWNSKKEQARSPRFGSSEFQSREIINHGRNNALSTPCNHPLPLPSSDSRRNSRKRATHDRQAPHEREFSRGFHERGFEDEPTTEQATRKRRRRRRRRRGKRRRVRATVPVHSLEAVPWRSRSTVSKFPWLGPVWFGIISVVYDSPRTNNNLVGVYPGFIPPRYVAEGAAWPGWPGPAHAV